MTLACAPLEYSAALLFAVLVSAQAAYADGPRAKLVDGRRDLAAIAVEPEGAGLAYAGGGVVWLRPHPDRPAQPVFRGRVVRDLRFDAEGRLWIATDRGLFARGRDGQVVDRSPGPGASREVRRLAAGPRGSLLCATGRGAFLLPQAAVGWQPLDGALPEADLTAVAASAEGDRVWLVRDGALHGANLVDDRGRLRVRDARSVPLPGVGEPVHDLWPLAGEAPGDLLVLTSRTLVELTAEGGSRVHRLPLPPGAVGLRLAVGGGLVHVAGDHGVIQAPGPAGPWAEVGESLARSPVASLALAPAGAPLWAVGSRGLYRVGAAAPAVPTRGARAAGPLPPSPGWPEVHRATLRHLELDPGPLRSLAARSRARGWLPDVELRAGYGGARQRELDQDEAFTGGELRLFEDRERSRSRDFDVVGVLRWELGDTVYHPEELDIAKERREVIELRDEVLDEVRQLYFEWQRVVLELGASWDQRDPESQRRALRADELAAGLDAWTGGWWSQRVPPLVSSRPPSSPRPRTEPSS
ncbi:MAG: hypothetical protein CL910_12135 [Deltaproteobacteria bacterium]|jgi:hypothetical protein|nr:hypothetical protein [Deltaproteobacteria bacterium]